MIHLHSIDKKLTEQGFDTIAILNKLPEMVATLTALAEHLEAYPSSTRTVLGLHLWQDVFAAVRGIKDGGSGHHLTCEYWDCECAKEYIHPKSEDSCPECGALREDQPDSHVSDVMEMICKSADATIDDLVSATKNYGTLLATGSFEQQQVAHDHLLEALHAYQNANRLNSDGDAELFELGEEAIMKADAAKLETKTEQSWQVTLRMASDRVGDEDARLDCWLKPGEDVSSSFRVAYVTETQLNLIAAAPELLEALKGFVYAVENEGVVYGRVVDGLSNAKTAIAKAEGK
jgi:hypothetical protein